MLAPVGIGADTLWTAWRTSGRQRALVVSALLLCAGMQVIMLLPFPDWSIRLIPPIVILCVSRRQLCYSRIVRRGRLGNRARL